MEASQTSTPTLACSASCRTGTLTSQRRYEVSLLVLLTHRCCDSPAVISSPLGNLNNLNAAQVAAIMRIWDFLEQHSSA
jgi:hypothetical protein